MVSKVLCVDRKAGSVRTSSTRRAVYNAIERVKVT